MIKIKNLNKSYFENHVLENVNLEIKEGKFTTLLGENGSGKSTLLNILSGYELPTDGVVTYKDQRLDSFNFRYIHDIFFVHEKIDYSVPMMISEYIELLTESIPNWDFALFEKMVADRKIDLDNNFQNLSRGQKMQVALMIGLASSAKILLLDEITSVIDVYGRKYFLELLQNHVAKGNTVVITTNIINELEFYTEELIVIKDKTVVLNKPVDEIPLEFVKIRQPAGIQDSIFENDHCVWAGVNSDKSVSYILPANSIDMSQIPKEFIDRRKSSLEDVFIYYFSNFEVGDNVEDAA